MKIKISLYLENLIWNPLSEKLLKEKKIRLKEKISIGISKDMIQKLKY